MNLHSMTGFGSAQGDLGEMANRPEWQGMRLSLDIRSVNSRFLDFSCRLPEDWRALEAGFREAVSRQLARGKVEVRVAYALKNGSGSATQTPSAWHQLKARQDAILAYFPQARPLSVADVLRWDDTDWPECSELEKPLMALCEEALQALTAARLHEGSQLGLAMLERLAQLRALAAQAQPLVPEWVNQQQQRFLQRWGEAMASTGQAVSAQAAQERALTEATAHALRVDVSEEITRLQAHIDTLEATLTGAHQPKGVGKRLDFLIQELHREANTLGSKSSTLALSSISVEMKVLIEQLREQVQNIE